MAPEIIQGKSYDSKCDTWSMGVLLYIIMSGYLPFQGENRNELFRKIKTGKYNFSHTEFDECSAEVIDLIRHLLQIYPEQRYSAQ